MKASLTKTLLFLAVFAWAGGYFPSTPVSADPPDAKSQKTAVVEPHTTRMQSQEAWETSKAWVELGMILYSDAKVFSIAGGEEKPPVQQPPPTTEEQGPKLVSTETKDGVETKHYDDGSKTVTWTYPNGTKAESKYDKDGKETSRTYTFSDGAKEEDKYDKDGRKTSVTWTYTDGRKTEYKYDKDGKETSRTMTTPDGSSVTKGADGSITFNEPPETPAQPTAGGETEGTGLAIPIIGVPGAIGRMDAGAAANRSF